MSQDNFHHKIASVPSDIKRIGLAVDVAFGRVSATVCGYRSNGCCVVLEHVDFPVHDALASEEDPYADLPETEVEFLDGQIVRLKAKESDLRILATKLREGERDDRVGDDLYDKLKRAQLALAEAKVSRWTEGVEAELLYLYRIDRTLRARVREMIEARQKAA